MVGFLKRLFGGGQAGGDKDGLYFYFRADRSGEVIQVRLHRFNDLSLTDDGKGYFTRKLIVGPHSYERLEAEFMFDRNRNLQSCEVTGGEMVEQADYEAYLSAQEAAAGGGADSGSDGSEN